MLRWVDIQYWCDTYGLDTETARAAHAYTAEMDYVWLSLQPKRKESNDGLRGGHKRR